MKIIGVTGSLGTGKTTVAKMFQALGARVLDADAIAHDLLRGKGATVKDVIAAFGKEVLTAGCLDRRKLADIVFSDPSARRRLERIIHPRVKKEIARQVRVLKTDTSVPAVILDVPLLFEAGMAGSVDAVVVVKANQEMQRQRSTRRLGISRGESSRRMKAQLPIRDKIRRADIVIDNRGTPAATRRQVKDAWQVLIPDSKPKRFLK